MTYLTGDYRTEFSHSGLFVRIFASLAHKHTCFYIFYVNGSPYKLAVILVVITNIPIIILYSFGGVVSISLTTSRYNFIEIHHRPQAEQSMTKCVDRRLGLGVQLSLERSTTLHWLEIRFPTFIRPPPRISRLQSNESRGIQIKGIYTCSFRSSQHTHKYTCSFRLLAQITYFLVKCSLMTRLQVCSQLSGQNATSADCTCHAGFIYAKSPRLVSFPSNF